MAFLAMGLVSQSRWPAVAVVLVVWAMVYARDLARGQIPLMARFGLLGLFVLWLFA